jgi:hypothetical protein
MKGMERVDLDGRTRVRHVKYRARGVGSEGDGK